MFRLIVLMRAGTEAGEGGVREIAPTALPRLTAEECLVVAKRADVYPAGIEVCEWHAPSGMG